MVNLPISFRDKVRQTMREKRRALAPDDRKQLSEQACKHLLKHPRWPKVKRLAMYWPYDYELDVQPLYTTATAEGKRVFLPRIINSKEGEMVFIPVRGGQTLITNTLGIQEPAADQIRYACDPATLDWIVVPCLALTDDGVRLGAGGGFYDRLLQFKLSQSNAPTNQPPELIAMGYDFQRIQKMYAKPHDVPIGTLVTETGIHYLL